MDKRFSAFQIILLVVFATIGVAAVLIFALATAGNSTGAVGPVVIWGTLDQNSVNAVLRKVSDTDGRFDRVTYVQKDATTFESDLANALASGTGPDIFFMRDDEALYDAAKAYPTPYATLSQSQFQNLFVDAADVFLSQSGVVGIPVLVDPLVLYWNRDMLASNGISEPPQYWNQVSDYAQKITQKSDTGVIQKSAIALGTFKNIDAAKGILAMLIMQAGGSITGFDSNGKVVPALTSGSSGGAQAKSALLFYTEFANPSQSDYTWSGALPNARQAFAAGDLALYIGYGSESPLIHATNPNLNFAVAAMPQLPNASNKVDGGHVYALAVSRAAHNPQGALTIAYLIGNSSSLGSSLATALGMASARRDTLAMPATGGSDVFNKMALIVHTWQDPDPQQTAAIFQAMIENTESGAAQVSDAIQKANQQLSHLLGQ